jgi:hypothetical protein
MAKLSAILKVERDQVLSIETMELWSDILNDVPDNLLAKAILEVLQTQVERFPITVGAIYQSALKMARHALPTSGEAWEMTLRAIRECRYYPDTGFMDGGSWEPVHRLPFLVRRAAEQVGINALANGNTGMAERAKFVQFYEELNHVFERPVLASGGDPAQIDAFGKTFEEERRGALGSGKGKPRIGSSCCTKDMALGRGEEQL